MLERARRNGDGLSDKEMLRAARCVRNRYWRAYLRGQRMVSLNAVVNERGTELWETLPDPAADLSDLPERLDAHRPSLPSARPGSWQWQPSGPAASP